MACGECAAKTVLIIINLIFQILGFALLLAGILIKVAWDLISGLVWPLLQGALSSGSGSTTSNSSITDTATDLLGVVAYVFIGLGGFMVLISILGCAGACCKIRTLLIVYTILVLLMLLAKLIFLVLLITSTLDATFKSYLLSVINTGYGGISDTSTESFSFNLIMANYQCCGVNDYKDFDTAQNWKRTYTVSQNGSDSEIQLVAPVVCCKATGTFPDIQLAHANCTWQTSDITSNWKQGCWESIQKEIESYKTIIIGSYAAVLGVEAICAAFAIFLIVRTMKDEKEGKINPMLD